MTDIQHFDVSRGEQARPLDDVSEVTPRRADDDLISSLYPLQLSKMRVPVAGNPNISDFARQPSPLDVADALVESTIIRALQKSIREL